MVLDKLKTETNIITNFVDTNAKHGGDQNHSDYKHIRQCKERMISYLFHLKIFY